MELENITIVSFETDAGLTITGNCPVCGDQVRVAQYPWWEQKCSCGIKWEINLSIAGNKIEINL